MATNANGDNLLLGRGAVYFDRFVNGVSTGERHLGNVTKFEVSTEDETVEKYSSVEASSPLLKKVLVRRNVSLALTLEEFSKENLALVLMGENDATFAQTGGGITGEAIAGVEPGRYYKLANRGVSAVVVTGTGGTPTYNVTTDYLVDADSGRIYIVPGGTITSGTDLEVDYTATAITAGTVDTIRGGVTSVIEGAVRFIGDPSSGPAYEVEVWKVSVNPDGVLAMIGDDFGAVDMTFAVLSDAANHPAEPLYRAIKL